MREETFSIYCAVYRRSSTYEKKKIEEEKSPCLLYFSTKNLLVYFSIDKKQDARMLIFFSLTLSTVYGCKGRISIALLTLVLFF
jgi:hypothetical protein